MILKWLLTSFIVYTVYRWFIRPKMVGTNRQENIKEQNTSKNQEGEYIDYEEVD